MNKRIISFFLSLVLGIALPAYAQKIPVKFFKPGFPKGVGTIDKVLLQTNIQAAARQAGITSAVQLNKEVAKADIAKSAFRAYPLGETDAHALSGFVFKTTYQGKEEIFGVIAQHAMKLAAGNGGDVEKYFTARVMQNDQVVDIPAEVVQMSSPTLSDVALVKFRPEDEPLLTPLTLAEEEPAQNEPLTLIGFGVEKLTFLTDTPLLKNSLISLRFPMIGEGWSGLCGGPVLNEAGNVVGTMTGIRQNDLNSFTGYATRNLYLRSLVSAYHNDVENASFPLILGGEKIIDLKSDEYIPRVIVRDENHQNLLYKVIKDKFPYSSIEAAIPGARYIDLYISKVWWSGYALVEGAFFEGRHVQYDLKEKKIIWSDR